MPTMACRMSVILNLNPAWGVRVFIKYEVWGFTFLGQLFFGKNHYIRIPMTDGDWVKVFTNKVQYFLTLLSS